MDPERWRRIKEAFSAALELPTGQREEWLSITIPDDPSLAREVRDLLAAHDGASDFYDQGAAAAIPELKRQLEGAAAGLRVGPYRVLSELGHGGMGAVYLAVRDQPGFTQKVALKLIKRGMDTDEIVRRFVAERQILASLAHPNIARLFDGGSTPDGRPYFVMEHVEGSPITAYAEENKLPIEDRLRLFLRVCRAVQHAHQSLVVHRDLKPANILVDAQGDPKLLDFGIAKLLDPSSFGGMTALTGLAPGPMTPDYASPEQRTGGPVTTATDVYGLGLLLYELLVGQNPQAVERKLGKGWADRAPSQAVLALSGTRDADARRLARRVAGDLDTIAGKALEREPERRYGTAAALAEDVERHLTQRPVAARRPTLAYRMSRSLVRHKLAAALALAVGLFAITSFSQFLAVRRERDRAESQRQIAQSLNDLLLGTIQRADPEQSRGKTLTFRQVLDAGSRELWAGGARRDAETRAALLEATGSTYASLGLYEEARRHLEQALKLRERQRSSSRETSLSIADNWTLLGHVGLYQERYDASRDAYRRAIAIKRRFLGPSSLRLVKDWNGLAMIAFGEGDLGSTERLLHQSLAACRRAGGDPRELAETLNDFGKLAVSKGEPGRAQIYFNTVWQHYRLTLGEDHPDSILVQANLANALFQRGEYLSAEKRYQEVVDLRRRLLGPAHPDLARSLLELAIAQRQCGHLDKAGATLNEVVRIRQANRFPADEDEAETWNILGRVDLDQGKLDLAEAALKKSFGVYSALTGDRRSDLSHILTGLATIHRRRADLPGAIALARRSLDLMRAAQGEEHPAIASPLRLLAELLQQSGNLQSAEIAYRQAFKVLSGSDWVDHPDKARVSVGLGGLLVETGRAGEARSYLEDGWRIQRATLPARDPATARTESELGACYAALGDGRARGMLEHGYQILLELRGSGDPDTRKAGDRLRRLPPAGG